MQSGWLIGRMVVELEPIGEAEKEEEEVKQRSLQGVIGSFAYRP